LKKNIEVAISVLKICIKFYKTFIKIQLRIP